MCRLSLIKNDCTLMMDVTWPSDEMFLPLKRDVQMHRINFWDHDAVRQREKPSKTVTGIDRLDVIDRLSAKQSCPSSPFFPQLFLLLSLKGTGRGGGTRKHQDFCNMKKILWPIQSTDWKLMSFLTVSNTKLFSDFLYICKYLIRIFHLFCIFMNWWSFVLTESSMFGIYQDETHFEEP